MLEYERSGSLAESVGDWTQSVHNYELSAEYARTLYYYADVSFQILKSNFILVYL